VDLSQSISAYLYALPLVSHSLSFALSIQLLHC
jgi:hypothetical protein